MCVECVVAENTSTPFEVRVEFYDIIRELSAQIKPSTEVLEQDEENENVNGDESESELYVRIRNCYEALIALPKCNCKPVSVINGEEFFEISTQIAATQLRETFLDLGLYLSSFGLSATDVDVMMRIMIRDLKISELYQRQYESGIDFPESKLRGTIAELRTALWLISEGAEVRRSTEEEDLEGIDLVILGLTRSIFDRVDWKNVQVKSTGSIWPPREVPSKLVQVPDQLKTHLLCVEAPCRYTL